VLLWEVHICAQEGRQDLQRWQNRS